MISFLQINIRTTHAAYDLMMHTASKERADIIFVSEQNLDGDETNGWFADSTGRSAVVVVGTVPVHSSGLSERGFGG